MGFMGGIGDWRQGIGGRDWGGRGKVLLLGWVGLDWTGLVWIGLGWAASTCQYHMEWSFHMREDGSVSDGDGDRY